jgi:Zn-dependent M28 family amino/carboxypeptidase
MGMDITGFFLDICIGVAWGMAVILLFQDIWEAVASLGKYSPGANDNGSGTALLASTALEFAANPMEWLVPVFLFTGAEETGLHGARQFAAYMKENSLTCPVISVDMIGAGSMMRITTQCGTIRPVKADTPLNELIKRADPTAVYHAIPRRWGDFVPFVQAGIPATHLENVGTPESWASYHTPKDTLDTIDDDMMHHMSGVITQVMWILEKDKHNPVKS